VVLYAIFKAFTVVKIRVAFFWVVTPCRCRYHGSPKSWYPTTTLHVFTARRTPHELCYVFTVTNMATLRNIGIISVGISNMENVNRNESLNCVCINV
jgi:hypothetical protein